MEYIGELREEQSNQIDSARNAEEMRKALRDNNDMENEIENIKRNLPFKMRMKIFKRTLSYKFTKLLRKIWKNKKVLFGVFGTLLLSGIGLLLNQLGVIALGNHIKNAGRTVFHYANDTAEMGKRIIKTVQSLYRVPGNIFGILLILLSFFIRVLYYLSFFSGGLTTSWIFGILGGVIEIALYFDTNIEVVNEELSNIVKETGNSIENTGIRAQNYIKQNSEKWVMGGKPNKTLLQTFESAAIKGAYKFSQGVQFTGEKISEAAELMREAYYYLKIIVILLFTILGLILLRDLSSYSILNKNGKQTSKSATKRRKKT